MRRRERESREKETERVKGREGEKEYCNKTSAL